MNPIYLILTGAVPLLMIVGFGGRWLRRELRTVIADTVTPQFVEQNRDIRGLDNRLNRVEGYLNGQKIAGPV